MKKILFTIFITIMIILSNLMMQSFAMQNPWVDCEADFNCAEKVSSIKFPLRLSNYWLRAMDGMIEIGYPLDECRSVDVRKTKKIFRQDISGVYTKYPINKQKKLKNGDIIFTRGTFRKIYVMNINSKTGVYSAYCDKGMSKKEAQGVYEVIKEAEER